MKAMVVNKAQTLPEMQERAVPEPGPGEVRICVGACGVCHSDHFIVDGLWPGLELPRVPGHEVAGVVDSVGAGVTHLNQGDRVGLGWHGGHDGSCPACLQGKFIHCSNAKITGISIDGGYAEYLVAAAGKQFTGFRHRSFFVQHDDLLEYLAGISARWFVALRNTFGTGREVTTASSRPVNNPVRSNKS